MSLERIANHLMEASDAVGGAARDRRVAERRSRRRASRSTRRRRRRGFRASRRATRRRRSMDMVTVECPSGHRWEVPDDKGANSTVFQQECPECGLFARYVV